MSKSHPISDQWIPEAFLQNAGKIDSKDAHKALGLGDNYETVGVRGGQNQGNCKACGEKIVGASVKAMDCHFHQKCFTCSNCKKAISVGPGSSGYGTSGDAIWCTPCIDEHKQAYLSKKAGSKIGGASSGGNNSSSGGGAASGARCAKCSGNLSGKYMKTKEGTTYHAECFVCAICKADLSAGYKMHNSKPHCGNCYTKQVFTADPYRNKIPPASVMAEDNKRSATAVTSSVGSGGAPKFCPECGSGNDKGAQAKFCGGCGHKF